MVGHYWNKSFTWGIYIYEATFELLCDISHWVCCLFHLNFVLQSAVCSLHLDSIMEPTTVCSSLFSCSYHTWRERERDASMVGQINQSEVQRAIIILIDMYNIVNNIGICLHFCFGFLQNLFIITISADRVHKLWIPKNLLKAHARAQRPIQTNNGVNNKLPNLINRKITFLNMWGTSFDKLERVYQAANNNFIYYLVTWKYILAENAGSKMNSWTRFSIFCSFVTLINYDYCVWLNPPNSKMCWYIVISCRSDFGKLETWLHNEEYNI